MDSRELKDRTLQFGLRIMRLVNALPRTSAGRAIGNQLIRSGTSVGANYRAACRGRSKAEFIAKLGIVVEEVDECGYWLELIMKGELLPVEKVQPLYQEAEELTAIFVASVRSAQSKIPNQKSKIHSSAQSKVSNQKSKISNSHD